VPRNPHESPPSTGHLQGTIAALAAKGCSWCKDGLTLALVAALVASVAVGSARASAPLTAPAYLAKANAICADLNRYKIPVTVAFVPGMQGALKKARESLSALAKLRPPTALAPLHAQVLRAETRYLAYFASLIAKVRARKLEPAEMVAALARSPQARSGAELWRKIGANVCATD
jgi:hypothetical protein